jgi:hypothetical protein
MLGERNRNRCGIRPIYLLTSHTERRDGHVSSSEPMAEKTERNLIVVPRSGDVKASFMTIQGYGVVRDLSCGLAQESAAMGWKYEC